MPDIYPSIYKFVQIAQNRPCFFVQFFLKNLLTNTRKSAIIKARKERADKLNKQKEGSKTMTREKALNKIVNNIEKLRAIYPEQNKLIDDMLECALYDICDVEDIITYLHEMNIIMDKLFEAIDIEAFDNRELSDKEYAAIINEIEKIATDIDSDTDEYINYLMYIYDIYD